MKKNLSVSGLIVPVLVFIAAVFTGCATEIPFQVQRAPAWNTLGIQRLAVLPFTTSDGSQLQRQAATLLTNESRQNIQATNHFTLVNADEVQRVRARGESAENLIDAYFTGNVTSVSVSDTNTPGSYRDRNGNLINFIDYRREVTMSFNYDLTSTRGSELIGSDTKTVSTSSMARDNPDNLATTESLIQSLARQYMRPVGSYMAPYFTTERRTLQKETSNDKALKQRASDAEALAKSGNYRLAQEAFLGIYRDSGSVTAAYNAAMLTEIMGDAQGAITFLQTVYAATGNQSIAGEISRLRNSIAEADTLQAFADNQSQRDRVVAMMVETLPSKLPVNPRVALINNSQNNTELAETVTNAILEGLLTKNITVVDRNNRTLMEMERIYQFSGNVSDEDIIRIGHEAGVNTFIMVAVTGTSATRRLSVQVLDVERSTVLYQSPQSNEMNL
ncbi:MAG: hypothetical protein FWC06_03685 [Treponema sp.]|nr:hypothetical protein [Treponema sp.]